MKISRRDKQFVVVGDEDISSQLKKYVSEDIALDLEIQLSKREIQRLGGAEKAQMHFDSQSAKYGKDFLII